VQNNGQPRQTASILLLPRLRTLFPHRCLEFAGFNLGSQFIMFPCFCSPQRRSIQSSWVLCTFSDLIFHVSSHSESKNKTRELWVGTHRRRRHVSEGRQRQGCIECADGHFWLRLHSFLAAPVSVFAQVFMLGFFWGREIVICEGKYFCLFFVLFAP